MKFQSVLVFFAAAASASSPPTCKGLGASYCKHLSNRDASECRKQISKNHLKVATCQAQAKTITSTYTKCPVVVTTKTIAPPPKTTKIHTTVTNTGKPVTPPTITVTAVATKINTITVVDRTTSTELRTSTTVTTDRATRTQSVTKTVTSTTTLPLLSEQPTCTAVKRVRGYGLPTTCSCFLTTTRPAATQTAVVTKKKPAVTHTVYKIGGPQKTIRRTITVTRYQAGPTLVAPETTTTRTTTITQTDHSPLTVTESQTSTATETDKVTETLSETKTESATATSTPNPCDFLDDPIQRQQIYGDEIEVTTVQDAVGPDAARSCCLSCYARPNCVFYRLGGGACEVISTVNTFSGYCTSPQCPRGFVYLNLGSDDGKDYYLGPCLEGAAA